MQRIFRFPKLSKCSLNLSRIIVSFEANLLYQPSFCFLCIAGCLFLLLPSLLPSQTVAPLISSYVSLRIFLCQCISIHNFPSFPSLSSISLLFLFSLFLNFSSAHLYLSIYSPIYPILPILQYMLLIVASFRTQCKISLPSGIN